MPTFHINSQALQWRSNSHSLLDNNPKAAKARLDPQKLLPIYSETPLHTLPSLAKELGVGHVLLKDESMRFGLPSFKILGASWAVYRAVVDELGLEHETANSVDEVRKLAKESRVNIVTCTAGNWGRAVARMGRWLGVSVVVYVSSAIAEETKGMIRDEGADVVSVDGDYVNAVERAKEQAMGNERDLLVMDIGWEGYEKVPQWVVEGYQTMLDEIDSQAPRVTGDRQVTHVIVPVGCGSIAQAVTKHFKSAGGEGCDTRVIAVEPTSAACLKESLEASEMIKVTTGDSIMCGMNCGILSTTAWPVLKNGVDVSVVVSEVESHKAVEELDRLGVQAGPCGAASLAALRRLCEEARAGCALEEDSVVVLCCTEGSRNFEVPI